MKKCRHTMLVLLALLLASGAAADGCDPPADCRAQAFAPGSIAALGTASPYLAQPDANLCDLITGSCLAATNHPAACRDSVACQAAGGQELDQAKLDDETLGRVSGGAAVFSAPDVINRGLLAIILWDEGKPRRSAPASASYEGSHGQGSSTILVQGR